MAHNGDNAGVNRRHALECMVWAGTGVLWTLSGGVPKSAGLVGEALAAEPKGFTFLQISDSHIGFDKPANPNALGTLQEAIMQSEGDETAPRLHDSHRRHHPSFEARRIRQRRAGDRRSRARCSLRTGRARHHRRGTRQGLPRPLRKGHQGRRLVQLRRQRRAFHRARQCRRPQGRRPRQARRGTARLARRRPQGQVGSARRSSSSPTSRFGRSMPNGAGARTTARGRSIS